MSHVLQKNQRIHKSLSPEPQIVVSTALKCMHRTEVQSRPSGSVWWNLVYIEQ